MIQSILQNLLAEMVSIRDLPTILEAIADKAKATKNVTSVTEFVRSRLSRQICSANTHSEGYIPVVALSDEWERNFSQHIVGDSESKQLSMPPSKLHEFTVKIRNIYEEQAAKGYIPVLLTSSTVRPHIRSIIARLKIGITVMSHNEVHAKAKIRTFAVV